MESLVLRFQEICDTHLQLVGGKGLNLSKLRKIQGIQVPEGFCITTKAFQQTVSQNEAFQVLLSSLQRVQMDEKTQLNQPLHIDQKAQVIEICKKIQQVIVEVTIPSEIEEDVDKLLSEFGENQAYAVRSSGTTEDSQEASFAGQHDTFLNVIGKEDILAHVKKCWASLFSERAVFYRINNGFDLSQSALAVVIQKMVSSEVSGILFTADPITCNRKVMAIDATFGLGEPLVSGMVSADHYKVKDQEIIEKGTGKTLSDQQILTLSGIGRQIEAYFGCPHDIEWCMEDQLFYVVQSRPITTLFPIPPANDEDNHVYVSVGHQQMMTDAMKPLGLSFFLLTTPAPMRQAGGRLFVDVTGHLASPTRRKMIIETFGKSDPLIEAALKTISEREGFVRSVPDVQQMPPQGNQGNQENKGNQATQGMKRNQVIGSQEKSWEELAQFENNPDLVTELIRSSEASIEALRQEIQVLSGTALCDYIREDLPMMKRQLFNNKGLELIMIAMQASEWLNKNMHAWLGEKNVADVLSQAVPHNITSEMGLALLDVADVIRPYPEVIRFLQHVQADIVWEELVKFPGGLVFQEALEHFLTVYGMRCAGEIDVTKTRWQEKPAILIPTILRNLQYFEPGASERKVAQGKQEAIHKEMQLLEQLKQLPQLPDGQQKVEETKRMIHLLRQFIGYREYPKYSMINRYFIYKLALQKEAQHLVEDKVIQEIEDIYYLSFEELREGIRTKTLDGQLIQERKAAFKSYEKLTPPRVITSDGEIMSGTYRHDNVPPNAMVGLAVSSGLIEGRARVVLSMEDANLEKGDILVTTFTDPSWTPLFVSIKGLVTEVGGLMTHGAVIAREYGLPAVVGVENATKRIIDGQRLRVNGTQGYVEVLA